MPYIVLISSQVLQLNNFHFWSNKTNLIFLLQLQIVICLRTFIEVTLVLRTKILAIQNLQHNLIRNGFWFVCTYGSWFSGFEKYEYCHFFWPIPVHWYMHIICVPVCIYTICVPAYMLFVYTCNWYNRTSTENVCLKTKWHVYTSTCNPSKLTHLHVHFKEGHHESVSIYMWKCVNLLGVQCLA